LNSPENAALVVWPYKDTFEKLRIPLPSSEMIQWEPLAILPTSLPEQLDTASVPEPLHLIASIFTVAAIDVITDAVVSKCIPACPVAGASLRPVMGPTLPVTVVLKIQS
jgi:hypothetical protein